MQSAKDREFIRRTVWAISSALFAVLLLSIGSYIVMSENIKHEAASARVVSTSGHEHMYSQRIALLCLSLFSTKDIDLRNKLRAQIRELADSTEQSHRTLVLEHWPSTTSDDFPPEIKKFYFEPPVMLDQKIRSFISETRALIAVKDEDLSLDDPHLSAIVSLSTELLKDLDKLTMLYREEGERGIQRLQEIELLVLGATLLVLAGTGAAIFYPVIRRLGDELRQRTESAQALARMGEKLKSHAKELERSNQALDQFATIVAHDLRAPLRTISGFGELLLKKWDDRSSPEEKQYMGFLQGAIKRMDQLIVDLLAYSRVSSEVQSFEKIDMRQIVDEIAIDLKATIAEADTQLEIGSLPTIEGDRTQLRQLFQNLVQNALKFRHPKRKPHIKIYSERSQLGEQQAFRVIVEDNGIGFDQAHATRIFQVFKRLHTEEEYEGSGIGLAICKRVVERHHGQIIAQGIPGKGASIIALLPEHQEMARV